MDIDNDEINAQITRARDLLTALTPVMLVSLRDQRAGYVAKLVQADCDETRGRIKELERLLLLPDVLQTDIEELTAALSGHPDAANEDRGITG